MNTYNTDDIAYTLMRADFEHVLECAKSCYLNCEIASCKFKHMLAELHWSVREFYTELGNSSYTDGIMIDIFMAVKQAISHHIYD